MSTQDGGRATGPTAISALAVDAASEYLALMMVDPDGNYRMEAMQVLEAAAPHMLAAAWLEGRNSQPNKFAANPYWKPSDV